MKTEAKLSEYARDFNKVLTIPNAILSYNNKMLYSSYLALETQLSNIDPAQDPIIYQKINKLTQSLFDSWLMLGYRSGVRYGPKC